MKKHQLPIRISMGTKLRAGAIVALLISTPPMLDAQSVTDQHGNTFPLDSIRMPSAAEIALRGSGASCTSSGIFNIYFQEVGSSTGFDDPIFGLARRDVVCRVFTDLSRLIQPANDPYTGAPNLLPFVNILVGNSPLNGALAVSSVWHNTMALPSYDDNPLNNLSTPAQRQGVLDGEVWRTINSGRDSWEVYNLARNVDVDYEHGRIIVDLSHPFFTDPSGPIAGTDLYSVVAHEALHLLGFYSLTNSSGNSSYQDWSPDPSIYFSRFDLFLNNGSQDLVTDAQACEWSSNINSLDVTNPCSIFFEGSTTIVPQPIFSPTQWMQGSSMSHLDNSCGGSFLMHWQTLPNVRKIPSQIEANILCDIGYHTMEEYGDASSGWDDAHVALAACGARLAGVDDIFEDPSAKSFYTMQQGGTRTMSTFLDNDEDETAAGGIPTSYACLTIFQGGGSFVLGTTSFDYTPEPGFVGWAILRYVPLNTPQDKSGNYTYIYIEVRPENICATQSCNIVNGGDFEHSAMSTLENAPYFNWTLDFVNSPDLVKYDATTGAWVTDNASWGPNGWPWVNYFACPSSTFVLPASHNGEPGNNQYLGLGSYFVSNPDPGGEYVMFELCRPLLPGRAYVLDYWAYGTGNCGHGLAFAASEFRPCNQAQGDMNVSGGVNACNGNSFSTEDIKPPTVPASGWNNIVYSFTYTGSGPSNWLLCFPAGLGDENQILGSVLLDDVQIHPTITADATINPACSGQTNGSISLAIHYYPGSYSIYWNTGANTSTIENLATGTYTVTITDTELGCAAFSESYIVGESPTCCATVIIPDGTLASSLPGDLVGTTVDIQGQFIVDNDFMFNNATVKTEAGAEIVVQNGAILIIQNSSFTSCQGVMWKGITVEDGGSVNVINSFIDDAENAIAGLDGSLIWVNGTQFHNNRVAVGVPDNGLPYNNVACWVSNSTFYSAGAMPLPYPGQVTAIGAKGFAAVDVHNTSLDFTGGNNIIHSMSNGIVGHRSDMSVSGCTILNIQPDAAYAYTGNGAGIYARGGHGFFTLKQQGFGKYGTPSFNGCRWGVYTEYMNVRSTENNMVDMGTGYRVDRSGYMDVDILNNQVYTHYNGMDLRTNDGAAHILVQGNKITFGNDPACTSCRGYYAIYVAEGNMANPNSVVQGNDIHFLAQHASRFGIGLFAADDWLVADNSLNMTSNAFNLTGIWTNGCRRPEVSCNTVNSTGTTYPIDAQAAIRNNMGKEPLISCNSVDHTANGILFNGVAYNTDVRGNFFHNHRWPLHLDATAIIDAQVLKGNLWDPAAAAPVWGAWYEVTPLQAAAYRFWYNPLTVGAQPPSWSPANWFAFDPGVNYDCANHHGIDYCSQFNDERCKDCLHELDEKIAGDSLQNNPYTEETRWMLKGDLYKKLDDAPALLDSLPMLADFYADLQGSTTADFKAISDGQLSFYNLDSTVVAQLHDNRTQIEGMLGLVKTGLGQLSDSTLTPVQRQAILTSISGYRQNIRALSTWNATALQVASASKVLTADGVKAANASVTTSELIETNEKVVNEIYLSTVGKDVDAFTPNQASELFDIANQCPMVGGNAVFKARSLYWLIDEAYDFDDALLCLPHGIIVKSLTEQHASALSVTPNPAGDEATLVLSQTLDEPGVFVVFDALGSEVMRSVVPGEMPRVTINTSSLAPALYHYQVRGPSGVIGDGKITIVR